MQPHLLISKHPKIILVKIWNPLVLTVQLEFCPGQPFFWDLSTFFCSIKMETSAKPSRTTWNMYKPIKITLILIKKICTFFVYDGRHDYSTLMGRKQMDSKMYFSHSNGVCWHFTWRTIRFIIMSFKVAIPGQLIWTAGQFTATIQSSFQYYMEILCSIISPCGLVACIHNCGSCCKYNTSRHCSGNASACPFQHWAVSKQTRHRKGDYLFNKQKCWRSIISYYYLKRDTK